MRIGIISDTHGILKEEVYKGLEECQMIIHAGDIGSDDILEKLHHIAPVYTVKGNNDKGEWARDLPKNLVLNLNNQKIFVIHDLREGENLKDYDIIISGHSHKLKIYGEGKQTFINPGACGKKRFGLPLSMVILELNETLQISIYYIK